jgi:hypothetical protein
MEDLVMTNPFDARSALEQPPSERGSDPSPQPGRRTFLGLASGLAAGALALTRARDALAEPDLGAPPHEGSSGALGQDLKLRRDAYRVRVEAAKANFEVPLAPHPSNGDEERYPSKIATDTRALPHDERGEVDPVAWASAAKAYRSRRQEDFDNIILGGTRKLINPIGTLAVSLTGLNVTQVGVPPAPALASQQKAAEAVELYWQALTRDVPFDEYGTHPDTLAAGAELERLSGYTGPVRNGAVDAAALFRGSVTYVDSADPSGRTPRHVIPPGVLDGPYISQLLYRTIPQGSQPLPATVRVPLPGQDFLTRYAEWLDVQNGQAPTGTLQLAPGQRFIINNRDLAEYVHGGTPLLYGASQTLGGLAPLSPTNPYLTSPTQASSAASFALAYFQGLLALGVTRAIRAAYWNKWFVHRHLRPEAFGGLAHQRLANGVTEYPLHDDFLGSEALARSYRKYGTYLLPHAYPEGAPIHPAYPAGSAVIAGVQATLLKATFDESFVIPDPVVPDPSDPTRLIPYTGEALTIGGEINKLAVNYAVGRTSAGIHWRTDASASLALGEAIAISLLADERLTLREAFDGFTLTKFDGEKIVI